MVAVSDSADVVILNK